MNSMKNEGVELGDKARLCNNRQFIINSVGKSFKKDIEN